MFEHRLKLDQRSNDINSMKMFNSRKMFGGGLKLEQSHDSVNFIEMFGNTPHGGINNEVLDVEDQQHTVQSLGWREDLMEEVLDKQKEFGGERKFFQYRTPDMKTKGWIIQYKSAASVMKTDMRRHQNSTQY